MRHILAVLMLLAAPAAAQSPGTVNLVGPSGGGQPITPQAVNNAVNNALRAKQDYPGGGGSITWPTSTDLVISNGTNSPAGLAAINGDCVVGAGGVWTVAVCPGGGGISGPGTTVNGFLPLWSGTTGAALSAGFGLGTGIQTALGVNVGSAGAPVLLGGAGGTPSALTGTNITGTAAGLTAGTATAANGLNSATTTVAVSAATAPTTGQVLTATGASAATWQTVSASATSITPGTTTVVGATAPCVIENTATTVMGCTAETGTGSFVRATSPTLVTPALGTPASGVATNLTGTAASLTAGTATVANGLKSATTTVVVSAATAPTNGQVLTATGGTAATWQTPGTGSVSITSLTPNIVVAPSPITGTGTVSSVVPLNTQSGASYAILTGDNTQLVEMTNASATTMTIPVANSAGFLSGWGTSVMPTLAATVLTPASGTVCNLTSVSLDPGQFLGLAAGASTNYDCALGIPTSGTQNKVLATPNGSTGQPKLRALVAADLPSTAVTPGSYTSTNLTVDAQGRITAAANGTASAASITPGTTTVVGATAPCLIENSTSTTMACAAVGTGVVTALGNALSAAGGVTSTIASGTSAMGTSAISSAACATAVTTTATNTATTDVVQWGFNGDPTAVTGYVPLTAGMLTIIAYPSANNVNFKVCNNTSSSITPGAITLNWRIAR